MASGRAGAGMGTTAAHNMHSRPPQALQQPHCAWHCSTAECAARCRSTAVPPIDHTHIRSAQHTHLNPNFSPETPNSQTPSKHASLLSISPQTRHLPPCPKLPSTAHPHCAQTALTCISSTSTAGMLSPARVSRLPASRTCKQQQPAAASQHGEPSRAAQGLDDTRVELHRGAPHHTTLHCMRSHAALRPQPALHTHHCQRRDAW